jgi:predicted TIM-barrel fold metal-dependent hydrolase
MTDPMAKSAPRIIDFHTHFFPARLFDAIFAWFQTYAWPIQYQKHADELIAILKTQGVSRCVTLHYPHKAGMASALNAFAHELGKKYSDFVIPFGSVHPDDGDLPAILEKCFTEYQFKGLKIHCHVQRVAPEDDRLTPLYEICAEHKKIVLIHCGDAPNFKDRPINGYGFDVDEVSGLKRFAKVLKRFPEVTFVVPHLGLSEIEGFVNLLNDHENLYLDTAMAISKYFPNIIKTEWLTDHADRILFGTDFPIIPYDWSREKENLLAMELGQEITNQIFYENAARLLALA